MSPKKTESAVEGDWTGACRTCWRHRNMGVDWHPKTGAEYFCGLPNIDGSPCHGRLLISMTIPAARRAEARRRQKKAEEYKR